MKKEIEIKIIKNNEDEKIESIYNLPLYSSQIYNIISNTAQATRPKVVGQMSEIVPEFIKNYYEENNKFPTWEEWKIYYEENHKEKYDQGLERLKEYVKEYSNVLNQITQDESLAKIWYDKFIFYQNFNGFNYEKIIINDLQKELKKYKKDINIEKSNPELESKNIDYIIRDKNKEIFLSVKPQTFFDIKEKYNIDKNIIKIIYDEDRENKKLRYEISNEDWNKLEDYFSK